MLEKKEHDFGTVASGTELACRFPVTNVYKHRIALIAVRSSCGCTTPSVENEQLDPGQTGFIIANLNTRLNTGTQNSTLTLRASWSDNGVDRTGEATVTVAAIIRGSVSAEPNEITFDNVPMGTTREQIVRISAERNQDWRVENVQCSCEHLEVDLPQPLLLPQLVVYDMLVRLGARTPPGRICEQLILVPNDAAEPRIPLQVSGRVVSDFWVAPEALFLGDVLVGGRVSKKVVLRSRVPCRILSAKAGEDDIEFHTQDAGPMRQILEITLQAGNLTGELKKPIVITSDSGNTASVIAYARVVGLSPCQTPHQD